MAVRKTKSAPKTFEETLKRLEEIVETLEAGEVDLDKSLTLFEEGRALSRRCLERLREMEQKVRLAIEKTDGEVELRDLESDDETTETNE